MEDSIHPPTHTENTHTDKPTQSYLLNMINFSMNGTYFGIVAQSKSCGAREIAVVSNWL
jgi:hypothetical protein